MISHPYIKDYRERLRLLRGEMNMIFSPDTAARGYAKPSCPSAGHCAVVALYLRHYLTSAEKNTVGDVVRCKVDGVSHWYNTFLGGDAFFYVDLTGDQFGRPKVQIADKPLYDGPHKEGTRSWGADLQWRYNLFTERLATLRTDMDYATLRQFAQVTSEAKATSWGYLTLTTLIQSYKEAGDMGTLIPLLHYLVNPYTPKVYLEVIKSMIWVGEEPYPGVYDFLDRIDLEIARREVVF